MVSTYYVIVQTGHLYLKGFSLQTVQAILLHVFVLTNLFTFRLGLMLQFELSRIEVCTAAPRRAAADF